MMKSLDNGRALSHYFVLITGTQTTMSASPTPPPNNTAGVSDSRDPSGFLSDIIGAPVTVKLNSGVVYKGQPDIPARLCDTDSFAQFRGQTVVGKDEYGCDY